MGGGTVIAEVSDSDILTLFTPAGQSSSQAYAVLVKTDELEFVETSGGCKIKVLKRYGGSHTPYGEAKNWEEAKKGITISPKNLPRGTNAAHSMYSRAADKRGIFIFNPTEGNHQYTLVIQVNGAEASSDPILGNNVEISKRFSLLHIEWLAEGFQRTSGGTGESTERLYLFTN